MPDNTIQSTMLENSPPSIHQKLIQKLAVFGSLSEENLTEQWRSALIKEVPFREHLLKNGLMNDESYQKAVGEVVHIPYVDQLSQLGPVVQNLFNQAVPIRLAKKYLFYPHLLDDERLVLAVVSPWPSHIYEETAIVLQRPFFFSGAFNG